MTERLTDHVMATRELDLGDSKTALIIIGAPFPVDEKGEEFWCKYQIIGIGNEKIKRGIGGDSVQAICLALYGISNDLYFSDEYRAGRVRWEGGMSIADLGLPVSDEMFEDVRNAKLCIEELGQY